MALLHKECLCTELQAKPTGAAGVPGVTKFFGDDCQYHVLPSSASVLTVKDEGVDLTTTASSLNFVGAGVTSTTSGASVTVNIPKPTAWAWSAAGDGSATITFSDGTTLAVAAMPAPAVC